LLKKEVFLKTIGATQESAIGLFIPNTYEFYWNVEAESFVKKMKLEHEKFWEKDSRNKKAEELGLSKNEIVTLASIVEEESAATKERPTIAGLYLNRLEKKMKLQADPTIKFALKKFDLRRILFKHIDDAATSPYSTYANSGLPPGPICIPSVNAIDAVLNAEENDYIFMCAKSDFSGLHAFAKTHTQHEKNRQLYIKALNARNIK
jgi:UPF0755 protein